MSEVDQYYIEEERMSCSIDHPISERCPECCNFSGDIQLGTEYCEFCIYYKNCYEEKYKE